MERETAIASGGHNRLAVIALAILGLGLSSSPAAESTNVFLNFIRASAAELHAQDKAPATLEAWKQQRTALRQQLSQAWGGFPKAAVPLNPKKLGELQREGYRVEKIIFQTLPDVWMTANAYVPNQSGKLPAVLCVHGHWRGAKQDPNVQARCVGLAKLGFFVLAVDAFGAGERGVGKALGEYHGEMTAATLFPPGRPLSGLQVYENMRAVDYLLTRPEVDGERLGITGASGGGNQTMYAGAWDERFKAVVPVCSVGNYQAYLGPACCMCEVVPGAVRFTEEWGVLGLTAPRALMIINATRDGIQFSVGEARKSLAFVEPVYYLHGRPENVRHTIFESPHAYNQPMREAMYGWMTRHLKGAGDASPIPEPAMKLEEPEALRCFPGETRPDDWMTIPRFAAREGRRLAGQIKVPATAAAWRKTATTMKQRLDREVLGGTAPGTTRVATAAPGASPADTIQFVSERGIELTTIIRTGKAPQRNELVLVLNLDGEAKPAESALAMAVQQSGRQVMTLSLRATGEHAHPRDKIGRAPDHNTAEWSLWLGRPLLGQWVRDVRAALNAASNRTLPGSVTLIGEGSAGIVAIYAAALDARITRVVTVNSLASYVTDEPYVGQRLGLLAPGIVRDVGDVSHLAALLAPRPLVIAGGVNGGGTALDEAALQKQFEFTRQVYRLEQAAGAVAILPSAAPADIVAALK